MWVLSNTTGSFSNDDGEGNEHVKKETCLLRKTTNLHVYHAFMYIFSLSLHDYDVKMPNFTFLGESIKKATTNFSFFINLSGVRTKSTPEEFAYI